MEKKISYSTGSLALLLAVVGIVFIVNYASDSVFTRVDLTEGKLYTLSHSTRQTLSGLKDVVTIKGVFSSNIPSPWNQSLKEVQDLLREYEAYGKGKVKLEIMDPVGRPEMQDELDKLGIEAVQLPVQGMDQSAMLKVYASIYVQYLDKTEVIPFAFTTETMEYDLTSTIARLTTDKVLKIGIFAGEGRKVDEEFGKLKAALAKVGEVSEVTFAPGSTVDVNVMLVLSPFRMSQRNLYDFDQYLMRGGQAIILTDGARVFMQPGQFGTPMPVYAMPMNEQMDPLGQLLTNYGVQREYNLVMDKPYREYPVIGPISRAYPLFPEIDLRNQENASHPLLQGADSLILTWASSLQVQSTNPNIKAIKLITTSPESWVQGGQQLMVDPLQEPLPPLPVPGMGPAERTLAVLLSGKFKSAFTGQPVPGPEAGGTAAPPPPPAADPHRKDESPEINILVVGTSTFVSNLVPINIASNLNFVTGAAEWMGGGQKLSDIRKRKVEPRPVENLNDSVFKQILVLFVTPLAAPIGVIIFGIIRFSVRRKRRNASLEPRK